MSLILQAPVPLLTTTSVFPSPQFGDGETPKHGVTVMQSMNGTLYSFVKSNARSQLQYSLTLSRMKALELRAFILSYYRAKVRLTNHKGEVWDGYFTSNPFEFSTDGKSSLPGDAVQTITIDFEGERISAPAPANC
jgi:hypothetical protein